MIRPLILMSNGINSTLLLQHALMRGDADVLHVKDENNFSDVLHLQKLIEQCESLPESKGKVINVLVEEAPAIKHIGKLESSHLMGVLMAAMAVLNPVEHSFVLIGGGQDSSVIDSNAKLKQMWDAMITLSKGKIVHLMFDQRGFDLIDIVKSINEQVLQFVIPCDNPKPVMLVGKPAAYKVCRHCPSCKKYQEAVLAIKYKNVTENQDLVRRLEEVMA